MITQRLAIAALLGSLLVPGLAWADGEPFRQHRVEITHPESMAPQGRDHFAVLDTNRDGRISAEEAGQRALPEPFWILDRNQDGHLTKQEYRYRSM